MRRQGDAATRPTMQRRNRMTEDMLADRVDRLPINEPARAHARAELDRAERAVEWSVLAMDRLDALVAAMRRATRMRQRAG
jgi:hypothetical protein